MDKHLRVERLANGLITVWDNQCQWYSTYNADGSYRHSGSDNAANRQAVREFLARNR